MVLTVDIGNTNIVLGVFEDGELNFTARISTDKSRTSDEYLAILHGIFAVNKLDIGKVEGVIMSSVVPPLTNALNHALERLLGQRALLVAPGIKTGFQIKIDDPSQLGSDMVCNVAGALTEFSGPLIIFDLGTATTMTVVDRENNILGGAIAPGVKLSLEALSATAAQLPHISLEDVGRAIGKNTLDCMQSGVIYGSAAMLDGMADRLAQELGESVQVIATGGISSMIVRHCKHNIVHRPNLLVTGLYSLYRRNTER